MRKTFMNCDAKSLQNTGGGVSQTLVNRTFHAMRFAALFLCLFVAGIGNAWGDPKWELLGEQPVAGKSYYLYNTKYDYFLSYTPTEGSTTISLAKATTLSDAKMFTLESATDGGGYVYTVDNEVRYNLYSKSLYPDSDTDHKKSCTIETGDSTVSNSGFDSYKVKIPYGTNRYLGVRSATNTNPDWENTTAQAWSGRNFVFISEEKFWKGLYEEPAAGKSYYLYNTKYDYFLSYTPTEGSTTISLAKATTLSDAKVFTLESATDGGVYVYAVDNEVRYNLYSKSLYPDSDTDHKKSCTIETGDSTVSNSGFDSYKVKIPYGTNRYLGVRSATNTNPDWENTTAQAWSGRNWVFIPKATFEAIVTIVLEQTFYGRYDFITDEDKRGAFSKSDGRYSYARASVQRNATVRADEAVLNSVLIEFTGALRGYAFKEWNISANASFLSGYDKYDTDAAVQMTATSTDQANPTVATIEVDYETLPELTLSVQKMANRGTITISYENLLPATSTYMTKQTVNLTALAASETSRDYTVYSSDKITLTATPEEGYLFRGWYTINDNDEKIWYSDLSTLVLNNGMDTILFANFSKTLTDEDVFVVGESTCKTLEQALAAATASPSEKTIVQLQDYTIPAGNYTIPAGVALVVPYNEDQGGERVVIPRIGTNEVPTGAYRTLTLAAGAHLNVYGTIEVSGCQTAGTLDSRGSVGIGRPGAPTYGHMIMNEGSTITLNNGAVLRAWGFVTGTGEIDARRGAVVKEQFQLMDWKGLTTTQKFWENGNDAKYKVLPVNQYFIQNVEVPTTYHPGAKLVAGSAINTSYLIYNVGIVVINDVGIIGAKYETATDDKAVFLMDDEDDSEDTWVRKWYNPATDQQVYEINNSAYLGSLVLPISAMGMSITMDSRDYALPITNNFKIHLLKGDMHVTQNTVMLPGSEIEVNKKATVTIDEGQTLWLYDSNEWGTFVYDHSELDANYDVTHYFGYASRVKYRPGGLVKVNDEYVRNISSAEALGDAKLAVHGTVDVQGYIKTTDSGASITSTTADAGTIIFSTAAPANSENDKVWQIDDLSLHFVDRHCVSAKLTNGNGSFATTAETPANHSFCFINGAWKSYVQEDQCFVSETVNEVKTYYAKPQDYVALLSGDEDENHLFYSSDGSRTFIHAFDNDGNCQWWEVEDVDGHPELKHCTHEKNNTYYYYHNGDWLEKKFKVSWVNWDGSPINYINLEDDEVNYYMVSYGTTPQWLSANPTRANDASHEYSFAGWSPNLAPVTADVTYMATYEERDRMYAITFKNASDELIELTYCKLGEMPACSRHALASNEEWAPALGAVTGNQVYTLQAKNVDGPFTIRFVNWNGEELLAYDQEEGENAKIIAGNTPAYNGATPIKPADNSHAYTFVGWTPSIGPATQNMTYTAKFEVQQLTGLNVVDAQTITSDLVIPDVRISTTGSLNVTGSLTADNFYLESNGSSASGQIVGGEGNITADHIYFDYKVNAKNHKWYGVAVPWEVDATNGISVNGKTLILGKDFDIVYYNGALRAEVGKQKCWSYVEDGDKTLVPGRLYMIGLMMDAQTIRFEKKSGANILTTTTSVTAHSGAAASTDQGWNGVANPALFHAYINPGVTAGQVYNPETNSYDPILMNDAKFVVGQGAFVEVEEDKAITVTYGGAYAAPRRARAEEAPLYDVRIAPAEAEYTDRLFVRVEDEKEADKYVIGKDLEKLGVSKSVAQMWINRYNTELCLNTMTMENGVAEYPLGIFAPKAGEYTISSQSSVFSDQYTLYLTFNGEAIWNLSDAAYTLELPQGNTTNYGLRVSARAPQITTGIDEAVVDAKGETRKVMINDQVYIIRGENVYTIDGQLVK